MVFVLPVALLVALAVRVVALQVAQAVVVAFVPVQVSFPLPVVGRALQVVALASRLLACLYFYLRR